MSLYLLDLAETDIQFMYSSSGIEVTELDPMDVFPQQWLHPLNLLDSKSDP